MAVEVGAGDDAEGAGGDAVRAAVADVGLDVDVLELVVDDGARRARLLAGGDDAVLADVAHHEPAASMGRAGSVSDRRNKPGVLRSLMLPARHGKRDASRPILGKLFDELHVSPGRGR